MDVKEAIAFMRENKVLHLKLPDGLEVSLDPEAFVAKPVADEITGPDMDERGSAGLTRREQMDLYGQWFEGDFPKRKG